MHRTLPGIVRTLQWTRRIGYLAVACLKAAACPSAMVDATLTCRTYRIAFVIITLKLGPGPDETKQNAFLAQSVSVNRTGHIHDKTLSRK